MLNLEDQTVLEPALVSIRRAQKADLFALAGLVEEFAAHHGDRTANDALKLDRDLFGEQPFATVLVAEAEGQLVGYALVYPTYRATEGERGMELHHLYVKAPYRGQGIGRHLIDRAQAHARRLGCSFLSLAAATGNFAAYKFYRGQGFAAYPSTGMRFRVSL